MTAGLRTSAGTTSESTRIQHEPPRWGELFGVFCLIVLCDLTMYRGEGFAGYALLFFVAPLFLWLISNRRCRGPGLWIVSAMLAALAVKMVWCGSIALVAVGFALIVALAMTVAGMTPYVLEAIFFASQILQAGYFGIIQCFRKINQFGLVIPRAAWISVALPLLAFLVFGWIFVLANPDLVISFGEGMQRVFDVLRDWIVWFSPDFLEAGFWFVTLWVILGLLRPVLNQSNFAEPSEDANHDDDSSASDSFLYPAFRNTLVTVIVLFAIYLVFEFKRMWIGEFPDGFYYSGFAHEGAAWLTTALALATVLLSVVFRGSILRDRRIRTLRRLTWLWSLENLLLAAAVYHRLFIYVGFNGMSRMRIVGLYGISAVVVGFILVLRKIARNRKFLWLLRRHLWTLAVALYLLALTPMDRFVVGYNVRRILEGDPAPSVQISVHPINSEAILLLQPLLKSDDEIICEGVQALLAKHHIKAKSTATRRLRQAGNRV
ncbi:MAG: DUF4173 domain-containing protein, partial [Planctomycetes bacterium]|nr:DUF4173 domain-containing protein [Planctomycetota bacterium]